MNLFKNIGPGTLIAAAFIGPGTVTVCTLAGVRYGFTLLWAMLFSILATIFLQEMAARIGLAKGKGLAESIKGEIGHPFIKTLVVGLMLSAILIGNAAYEAGNISGGVLGLEPFFSDSTLSLGAIRLNYLSLVIGAIAFVLLYAGNYKVIERSLISLVVLMSLSFIITAVLTGPELLPIIKGLVIPRMPDESLFMILALIGTTVVPYNLFLHASLVNEKWKGVKDLKRARTDLYVSIILGGLVSLAIIISAAAIKAEDVTNATHLAEGLKPLFGNYAGYFLSMGMFAAGITSAITAPLAAAYVARGCFEWEDSLKTGAFRAVWMGVLLTGVFVSSVGLKPVDVIQFAQVANGILLPVTTLFLVWVSNRKTVLGQFRNSRFQNVAGGLLLIITLVLGAVALYKVFTT